MVDKTHFCPASLLVPGKSLNTLQYVVFSEFDLKETELKSSPIGNVPGRRTETLGQKEQSSLLESDVRVL